MAQLINRSYKLTGCPIYRVELKQFRPEIIRDSGQIFRFREVEPGLFEIYSTDKRVFFKRMHDDWFTFYCSRREFDTFWKLFFDIETDYQSYLDQIDQNDDFLKAAAEYCTGLKILRSDAWEMLITFLLAQRKNLRSIENSIEKLCILCGSELQDCAGSYYAFPTPEQIASQTLENLESCGLGYRTPYVLAAARAVASGEISMKELGNLDNRSALERLKSLNGVGDKIAQCILLFGYHRIDTFPVDVWIERVEEDIYDGHFPVEAYDEISGIIQQYLFHYARNKYYKENARRGNDEKPDDHPGEHS